MADVERTTCQGCGLRLPVCNRIPEPGYNASGECLAVADELNAYTLTLGDPSFIHQHWVDAYGAQHNSSGASKIRTAFSLIGLYLAFEKGLTGRQVQRAHMVIARTKREWPRFESPKAWAALTVWDVLQVKPGVERDAMLMEWARSVWNCWGDSHEWARSTSDWLLEERRVED